MALTWTDWRGNDFTVGDTVLYARLSGRSCEMAEGVVTDLMVMYRDPDKYEWARLPEGEAVPEKLEWRWVNPDNPDDLRFRCPQESWRDSKKQVSVPVENERRAKIMPAMRTSRFNSYDKDVQPVTLRVTESITAIVP
jgi:hypothetical protein